MSLFVTATAKCPACRAPASLEYPASINADRRADLRQAILDRSLYTLPCGACGATLTFEPHITYLDIERGQWTLAEESGMLDGWRAAEAEAIRLFDRAWGQAAPAPARQIGRGLSPRLVFGWPALVEKMLCHDLGLDDVALECLKLAILRDGPQRRYDPGLELRLIGRVDDRLHLAWIDPLTGAGLDRLAVPESAYVLVKGGGADWGEAAALVAGRMFVDLNRLVRDLAAPQRA